MCIKNADHDLGRFKFFSCNYSVCSFTSIISFWKGLVVHMARTSTSPSVSVLSASELCAWPTAP